MISVQHNMLAINANRQLNINNNKGTKITEKLSSGYRINRAADDAAGLAISEKMRRQIRGLHQAADNIKDGIGYVQTAEGALNEVHDMLQRMNELSVKAANGTNSEQDRAYIDSEIQALKEEIDRVFSTTAFNEQKIWEPEKALEAGGNVGGGGNKGDSGITWRKEIAVTFKQGSTSLTDGVTNANCGVLAIHGSYYKTLADDNGIQVTWTAYDGNTYHTEIVPWNQIDIDANGVCSFKMEDYFGAKDATNKLYTYNTAAGKYDPVFTKTVSFTVNSNAINPDATIKDKYKQSVIDSINGATMSSSVYAYMSVDNDDCTNISSKSSDGVYVSSVSLNYPAAYLSWVKGSGDGYNFDAADDDFIEPNPSTANMTSDPIAANNDNGKWEFSFTMKGIGTVTAVSDSVTHYSNDAGLYKTSDKGYWWYTYYDSSDKKDKKATQSRTLSSGTLATLKDGLTGTRGVISKGNGGSTDTGTGYVRLNFTITPDDKTLTYGQNSALTTIGSFYVYVPVSAGDTSQTVLDKVKSVLNASTVLDFTKNGDSASIGGLKGKDVTIDVPVYPEGYDPDDGNDDDDNNEDVPNDTKKSFWVQAGAEAGQHIDIEYERLNIRKLGIADTNTLTAEDAGSAINEVKEALQIVSKQRSDFGAYQNRLEHAYNIDKNVEENTQASESLIRDTDIADAMMEYSVNNILMQAGVSMLTQANQSSQLILELLQ